MQTQRRSTQNGGRWDAEDVNRERLLYCCTSLVGQRVSVKLRGDVSYEGLFHSCALDADCSITLRCARQLSPPGRRGEQVGTLVINGKDFLQLSAANVPDPDLVEEPRTSAHGFATDGDIAEGKAFGGDRELVPWSGGDDGPDMGVALEEAGPRRPWDQFAANSQMYGITSTYSEELYTTKLDPQSIPREKREEAERIAREIESGPMASNLEESMNAQDEEQFGAVIQHGSKAASQRKTSEGGSSASQLALTKEHLTQHESASRPVDEFALEHRTKRGMITAHSPMRPPMVSEMKRINALNLEPALPKLDDKTRSDWINFKQAQKGGTSKQAHGAGLKSEFQQSLEVINSRTVSKQQQEASGSSAAPSQAPAPETPSGAQDRGEMEEARRPSKFSLNPGAKEFSFNPSATTFNPAAAAFTPSSSQQAASAASSRQSQGPQLPLPAARRPALNLLATFFSQIKHERPEQVFPQWPEATGYSYREVLGRPNTSGPPPIPPGVSATTPGPWQQQQGRAVGSTAVPGQMPSGTGVGTGPMAPQMMAPQGYMVAPGGRQQGYPPNYPGGYAVPAQRPPGGGQGGMPQMGQQGQGQTMGYGPQSGMMQPPPGAVMMPAGMVAQGAGQMGPAPKFGAQVLPVVGPGQYGQGFVQGQPSGCPMP